MKGIIAEGSVTLGVSGCLDICHRIPVGEQVIKVGIDIGNNQD